MHSKFEKNIDMKTAILILIILVLAPLWRLNNGQASESCFIAQVAGPQGKILQLTGNCDAPYTPQSTFKIVLSLIGFEEKILESTIAPIWYLPKGVDPYINVCKNAHNPATWMRDSCFWYSQILTSKLGMQKFQSYLKQFSYGNQDLSGGLTKAWVSSSLKISPKEQIIFLNKMVEQQLGLSKASYEKTKQLIFIQELAGGWKLYGKTGNGRHLGAQLDKNGKPLVLQHGWFIGYMEKDEHKVLFVNHIIDDGPQNSFASFRAKNDTLIQLWGIIEALAE